MECKRNEKLVRTYQSSATSFQIHRVCVVLESAFGYEDIISSCSCTFTRSFLVHRNCNRSLSFLLYTINLIICVLSSYIHTENHLNIVPHTIDDMNFPTVSKLYLMSNTHTIPTAFFLPFSSRGRQSSIPRQVYRFYGYKKNSAMTCDPTQLVKWPARICIVGRVFLYPSCWFETNANLFWLK